MTQRMQARISSTSYHQWLDVKSMENDTDRAITTAMTNAAIIKRGRGFTAVLSLTVEQAEYLCAYIHDTGDSYANWMDDPDAKARGRRMQGDAMKLYRQIGVATGARQ